MVVDGIEFLGPMTGDEALKSKIKFFISKYAKKCEYCDSEDRLRVRVRCGALCYHCYKVEQRIGSVDRIKSKANKVREVGVKIAKKRSYCQPLPIVYGGLNTL